MQLGTQHTLTPAGTTQYMVPGVINRRERSKDDGPSTDVDQGKKPRCLAGGKTGKTRPSPQGRLSSPSLSGSGC